MEIPDNIIVRRQRVDLNLYPPLMEIENHIKRRVQEIIEEEEREQERRHKADEVILKSIASVAIEAGVSSQAIEYIYRQPQSTLSCLGCKFKLLDIDCLLSLQANEIQVSVSDKEVKRLAFNSNGSQVFGQEITLFNVENLRSILIETIAKIVARTNPPGLLEWTASKDSFAGISLDDLDL
jgi:hypothetical protein